jgi:hypothetical protein
LQISCRQKKIPEGSTLHSHRHGDHKSHKCRLFNKCTFTIMHILVFCSSLMKIPNNLKIATKFIIYFDIIARKNDVVLLSVTLINFTWTFSIYITKSLFTAKTQQ